MKHQLAKGLRVVLVPAQAGQAMVFALLAPVVPAIAVFLGAAPTASRKPNSWWSSASWV